MLSIQCHFIPSLSACLLPISAQCNHGNHSACANMADLHVSHAALSYASKLAPSRLHENSTRHHHDDDNNNPIPFAHLVEFSLALGSTTLNSGSCGGICRLPLPNRPIDKQMTSHYNTKKEKRKRKKRRKNLTFKQGYRHRLGLFEEPRTPGQMSR